jgi:hypothetical protein
MPIHDMSASRLFRAPGTQICFDFAARDFRRRTADAAERFLFDLS